VTQGHQNSKHGQIGRKGAWVESCHKYKTNRQRSCSHRPRYKIFTKKKHQVLFYLRPTLEYKRSDNLSHAFNFKEEQPLLSSSLEELQQVNDKYYFLLKGIQGPECAL
jgi:hypothetical protein